MCVYVCVIPLQTISWAELQLLIEVGGLDPHILSFFLAAYTALIISKAVAPPPECEGRTESSRNY